MRFNEIEVQGITNIVINKRTQWKRNGITGQWVDCGVGVDGRAKTHVEMMKIVNILKTDRRYRMYIHLDTLNILKKEKHETIANATVFKLTPEQVKSVLDSMRGG